MGENDDAESLADIKMLRESGQQKQSPQWKCRHLGEREHSSCHPVPLVTTLSVSIRCSTSPCTLSTSCYLYLCLKVKIPWLTFTAMFRCRDESQGADFFGLFLAAMKDASVEFWEVWGEGTGNREGSRASFSAAAVTNTDTVKLLLGNSILSAWAFILTLELQEKWK